MCGQLLHDQLSSYFCREVCREVQSVKKGGRKQESRIEHKGFGQSQVCCEIFNFLTMFPNCRRRSCFYKKINIHRAEINRRPRAPKKRSSVIKNRLRFNCETGCHQRLLQISHFPIKLLIRLVGTIFLDRNGR